MSLAVSVFFFSNAMQFSNHAFLSVVLAVPPMISSDCFFIYIQGCDLLVVFEYTAIDVSRGRHKKYAFIHIN